MIIRYTKTALAIILALFCFMVCLAPQAQGTFAAATQMAAPSAPSAGHNTPPVTLLPRSRRAARAVTAPVFPREVAALRTRTSDTYIESNGVFSVHQSAQSINYQDTNGTWQPIDDTVIPATANLATTGYAYQNAANSFHAAFAAASGGSVFEQITQGSATLEFIPENSQVTTATVWGGTITYPHLFTQTDALYSISNDAVKESLVLHDATAPSSFTFTLQANGVTPIAPSATTAGVDFLDAAGRPQVVLVPLVARDGNGAATPVALTLILVSDVAGTKTYRVVATIPNAWLTKAGRAWPVTLDPTVILHPVQDTRIDSGNLGYKLSTFDCPPTGASGCAEKLVDGIGDFANWWSQSTTMRTLLQFDLSVLPPHVTLLNAQLQATIPTRAGNGYTDLVENASVYPLTTTWTANATWGTRDGSSPWTTLGGDYDSSGGVTAALDYSHDTYNHDATAIWDITAMAQQWYLGARSNDGLLIRMDDERTNSPRKLEWQNGTQVIYTYLPWLGGAAPGGARAFDPHASLKSNRALITFPQGDGQQMGVNVASGDMEIMRNDVSIPSLGLPNVIQRTFHSTAPISGTTALGHMWQLSVGSDSSLTMLPTGDALYTDPTGEGYDIPSVISATASTVLTDTTTQGNWNGATVYGGNGYIMNGGNNGSDVVSLPSYATSYSHPIGTNTVWQLNTTDTRALNVPGSGTRNATALTGITETQQVLTFNARMAMTASVYLLNWGTSPTSAGEVVEMQDATGSHTYHATSFNNGLWVSFTNVQVGPTQPLTVTIIGDPGSSALTSALTFDGGHPDGFVRAQGLPADLTQNSDGGYVLAFNNGLSDHFSSLGQYIAASDRHGNTEQFRYGGHQGDSCPSTMIQAITDTVGRVTTFSCDTSGRVSTITDADNRTVYYNYDGNNNLSSFQDRAGGVTQYQYNATNSLPVTITDPIGNQTVITYDASLRVSAVRDGAGSVMALTYGATNTTTVTDALNNQVVYTFDPGTGETLSETDPNGHTTRFTYDSNMELLTTIDPLGHVITNTTTSGSDQTSTTSPLGDGASSIYNALHEPTAVQDTQGYTTTTQYDPAGDPITTTDPLRNSTVYVYTSQGLPTALTDGNGHTVHYGYDAYGDTVAITDALGRVSNMIFDTSISRLSSTIDPKHQTTSFTYDREDRTTKITYQGGSTTQIYLDADGNITKTVDSTGSTTFKYDGDNRLLQQTSPDGTVFTYTYDAAGHLKTEAEPGLPLTTYSYDPAGNLSQVANSLWGPIKYSYDAANLLTALGYPNGITTTYTQDSDNRLTGLVEAKGGTTLFSDSFSFAKPGGGTWGLRSTETRNENGTAYSLAYGYDADARLTGVTETGALTTTYAYGYDAVGNLTHNDGSVQTFDAANQLSSIGSTTYAFDGNGNLTHSSASALPTWTYDAQNHTQSFTNTTTTDTFQTTGGQREQKSVTASGTTTTGTYDHDLMGLALYKQTAPTSSTVYYLHDPRGRLLALTDGSRVYYYGLDGHGSVVNLTDHSGVVTNQYRYDPYGNPLVKTQNASIANPWRYAGGFYDAESSLYLLGARYYWPAHGLFLQQDPLGSGGNSQYAYAGGDPCNNSDPSGMRTCYYFASSGQVMAEFHHLNWEALMLTLTAIEFSAVMFIGAMISDPVLAVIGFIATSTFLAGAAIEYYKSAEISPYVTTGVEVSFDVPDSSSFNNEGCPRGAGSHPEFGGPIVNGSDYPGLVPA